MREEEEKKEGAADYMPASRQEAHLTQPIWSRDKASFQTWLRRVDNRRGSRDYTRQQLQETLFQSSVFLALDVFLFGSETIGSFLHMYFFGERITGSHRFTTP